MKKLLSILALGFLATSYAQTTFGVKAGYNLSTISLLKENIDSKSYFYVGGVAEHKINDKFSVQGELLYTELGGKFSYDVTGMVGNEIINLGTQTANIHLPQLQIPISAKYYVAEPFSISAGLNFGINLNPNVKYLHQGGFYQDGKIDNISTLNIFPFLGTEYKLPNNLFFDARYNFNFFKINKEGGSTKVGFFQVGLGYRFK
ncbi:Outer membrane protein beta-barrel domain-containing protein [Soonwooa buanensis]|uniref:Outer membrane protein beta-barrel domain-containing protein n=1 Tax=Soonwooa buanensis TaxID=619805 RepID=A0A1T5DTF9_9FLAO|nr:porin family protein [Soonwooa buanensis]SKB74683.1 Outer membrane protein beta-barrel domain-containing protein [Soonwooa buanensis]